MKKQIKKCFYNHSTGCISSDVPSEMRVIVDLFNTWVSSYMIEYFSGQSFRYCGTYSQYFYTKDIDAMRSELLKYCNGEKSITIGMLTFSQQPIKTFENKRHPNPYTVLWREEFPVNPEFCMYELAEVLKVDLLIHEFHKIGGDIFNT